MAEVAFKVLKGTVKGDGKHGGLNEGAGGREPPAQEDVRRGTATVASFDFAQQASRVGTQARSRAKHR